MFQLFVILALAFQGASGSPVDTTRLQWVPNPRVATRSWIADPAGHLRPGTRTTIDSIIDALERETSTEIAVAVLDSLDGLEPSQAALVLHRRWGVGKAARDNGLVLLWSPAQRKTFISVGYGLEGAIPDVVAGRIQDQAMIPAFRAGDFDGGMIATVSALAATARGERFGGMERNASMRTFGRGLSGNGPIAALTGVVFAILAFLIWLVAGRRPRRCPKGHGAMRRLSEQADDAALDPGRVIEEHLGSVNYDVWVCPVCSEQVIVTHVSFWTRYARCPSCNRRTVATTTRVLDPATQSAPGRQLRRRQCKNCGFADENEVPIPSLQSRSSSDSGWHIGGSGGGGSSFGGGSSGGGGAGRSY